MHFSSNKRPLRENAHTAKFSCFFSKTKNPCRNMHTRQHLAGHFSRKEKPLREDAHTAKGFFSFSFLPEHNGVLLQHNPVLLEHNGVFPEQNGVLLEHNAVFPEHNGVVLEHNGVLLEQNAGWDKQNTGKRSDLSWLGFWTIQIGSYRTWPSHIDWLFGFKPQIDISQREI